MFLGEDHLLNSGWNTREAELGVQDIAQNFLPISRQRCEGEIQDHGLNIGQKSPSLRAQRWTMDESDVKGYPRLTQKPENWLCGSSSKGNQDGLQH